MRIRYHLDENIHHAVAEGLRRRGVDVTTSTEAGLIVASDLEQLAYSFSENRVIVTHDRDLLRLHQQGTEHAGIAYVHPRKLGIGPLILSLMFLWRSANAEEMKGTVRFL